MKDREKFALSINNELREAFDELVAKNDLRIDFFSSLLNPFMVFMVVPVFLQGLCFSIASCPASSSACR